METYRNIYLKEVLKGTYVKVCLLVYEKHKSGTGFVLFGHCHLFLNDPRTMAFQISSASVEAYKCSLFPLTTRDWNVLPDSMISPTEMSDDCVSKFASLVRVKD